jgi:dipeptidyl aminopeptidase/acylaminoacyl peptidase
MTTSQKRALQREDLFRIAMVSDPHLAPTGNHVAWVETVVDQEDDTYRSSIWIADGAGENATRLTSGTSRDANPRWSPDGRQIAFTSNRPPSRPPAQPDTVDETGTADTGKDSKKKKTEKEEEKPLPQVWVISIDGGEAEQVTNHPGGAGSHDWSPDGAQIVFIGNDNVADADDFTAPVQTGVFADERVIHDLRYRFDGRGWLESFSHVWTARLDDTSMTQRTFGDANDSAPAWSPDGTSIAFCRSPREIRSRFSVSTILMLDSSTNETTPILPEQAQFDSPVWSPDSERIAVFDGGAPGVIGENQSIATVRRDGSDFVNHTREIDISFGDYGMSDVAASSDGRPRWTGKNELTLLASALGSTHIYRIDLKANKARRITAGDRRIMGFAAGDDTLFFVAGEIHRPTELFVSDGKGKNERQVTKANTAYLEEVRLAEAIELDVTAPDGKKIQTWLLPPHDYDPASPAKFPLILQIHGGPHAMYSHAMFHEMQLMAAKNYGVVFCNPRGSAGYGQDFTMCTRGIWGESDMPDVMAAVDRALEQPWVDPARIGITGGSYGGYLTNWIIGHTDRFKAAVTQRCVSNFYSFFGTSDIGFDFGTYQSEGVPWADAEKLLKYSPISYVDRIETPLLIIHCEKDLRCPIEQGEQMFAALRYLGREVAFVRIPNEGHELSRSGTPSRRLARLQHMMGWFDSHL